jgi:hypothetical protein
LVVVGVYHAATLQQFSPFVEAAPTSSASKFQIKVGGVARREQAAARSTAAVLEAMPRPGFSDGQRWLGS